MQTPDPPPFRASWTVVAGTVFALLVVPWLTVATWHMPSSGCGRQGSLVLFWSGSGESDSAGSTGCRAIVHVDRFAPIALASFRRGSEGDAAPVPYVQTNPQGYSVHVGIVPSWSLVGVPALTLACMVLAQASFRLYGEEWRHFARWLVRPTALRMGLMVPATSSFWIVLFRAFAPVYASDDSLALALLPLVFFTIVTGPMARALARLIHGAMHAWGFPDSPLVVPEFSEGYPGALTPAGLAIVIPLALVAWYLLAGLLASFVASLRGRFGAPRVRHASPAGAA